MTCIVSIAAIPTRQDGFNSLLHPLSQGLHKGLGQAEIEVAQTALERSTALIILKVIERYVVSHGL